MIYRVSDPFVFVRLEKGEPVVATLTDLCSQLGLRSGWVQAIGAVDRIEFGAWDIEARLYYKQMLEGTFEISPITGNIMLKEGKPFLHLHATFAGHDRMARAGHLFEARVNPTLEVFMGILPEPLERRMDEETGLYLAWPL
jgi:predicted DNA-binding protein with PD1-like motif